MVFQVPTCTFRRFEALPPAKREELLEKLDEDEATAEDPKGPPTADPDPPNPGEGGETREQNRIARCEPLVVKLVMMLAILSPSNTHLLLHPPPRPRGRKPKKASASTMSWASPPKITKDKSGLYRWERCWTGWQWWLITSSKITTPAFSHKHCCNYLTEGKWVSLALLPRSTALWL